MKCEAMSFSSLPSYLAENISGMAWTFYCASASEETWGRISRELNRTFCSENTKGWFPFRRCIYIPRAALRMRNEGPRVIDIAKNTCLISRTVLSFLKFIYRECGSAHFLDELNRMPDTHGPLKGCPAPEQVYFPSSLGSLLGHFVWNQSTCDHVK